MRKWAPVSENLTFQAFKVPKKPLREWTYNLKKNLKGNFSHAQVKILTFVLFKDTNVIWKKKFKNSRNM
jgi:hypothetical protein